MYLFVICTSSRMKFPLTFSAHVSIGLFFFLLLSFKSALYMLNTSPFLSCVLPISPPPQLWHEKAITLWQKELPNPASLELQTSTPCLLAAEQEGPVGEGNKQLEVQNLASKEAALYIHPHLLVSLHFIYSSYFLSPVTAPCSYCNFRQKCVCGMSVSFFPDANRHLSFCIS